MKHLIFRNVIDGDLGGSFEKIIVSLDDLGIVNPKNQFNGTVVEPMVARYNFWLPQVYSNIKSQLLAPETPEENKLRGVGMQAEFDFNNIPFEKGEDPVCPTYSELLKEIYVEAVTANPGAGGPRGTSRGVIEMPPPRIKDAVSGRIYIGRWITDYSNQGLDSVNVSTGENDWKVICANEAIENPS